MARAERNVSSILVKPCSDLVERALFARDTHQRYCRGPCPLMGIARKHALNPSYKRDRARVFVRRRCLVKARTRNRIYPCLA